MPERTTHVETLRAGKPVSVGATTLLPIERVVLHSDRGNARVWFSAAKEPYAVVVRDAGGTRAVDTGALEVSLDELRERIPGFDALLMSM